MWNFQKTLQIILINIYTNKQNYIKNLSRPKQSYNLKIE